MLRTHSPLNSALRPSCVRLACLKHAASVHPEPGSNSPYELLRHFGPMTKTSGDRSCEHSGLTPNALIGQPTHRLAVQASLTTGVASYHSSVVKVRRAAVLPAPGRTDSTTPVSPLSRQTKNRCKAPAFASALRGPLYSLACLVSPMPAGLNIIAGSL